jgi:hypothetical protein
MADEHWPDEDITKRFEEVNAALAALDARVKALESASPAGAAADNVGFSLAMSALVPMSEELRAANQAWLDANFAAGTAKT